MAIFRKNRNKKNNTSPAAQNPAEPVSAAASAAQTAAEQPAAEGSDGFTPVLSFGTEPAPVAEQKPVKKDDIEGEVDSIAGIFGKSKSTASASKTTEQVSAKMSEVQNRWLSRRRKAVEQSASVKEAAEVSGDAPVIESMQSVPAEKRTRAARLGHQKPENPVSLAFADLSDRTELDPFEIEDATDIYGIKYPACFNPNLVDFSGRAIDFSNFSLVENLRWRHIERASDINGVVFPSSFDVSNANFFGRSLRSCDFSAVYALRWKHLEPAQDIVAVKYPATFDIEEADFSSRNISGSDFSLVNRLEWKHIAKADDIRGIRYPSSYDPADADYAGRDISGSDFSLVSRLRWEHIAHAAGLENIIYPADFDYENADFRGMDISGSDFTRANSFGFATIGGSADIRKIKYPECFDAAAARFAGRDISGSNFSRVSSLRWAHIRDAADITSLVYPPQFDIDEADFTDRDIDYSDFSLLPGFNWNSIRLADSREGVMLPLSFVVPKNTDEDVQGAMLITLLKLYRREFGSALDVSRFYHDITALYPGIEDTKAAELIDAATARLEQPDGKRVVELMAREAHVGDKLFMTKLGFKLLYASRGPQGTERILRDAFTGLFGKRERERFEQRLADLRRGKYLSASELEDIGFVPETEPKAERSVEVAEPEIIEPEIIEEEPAEELTQLAEAVEAAQPEEPIAEPETEEPADVAEQLKIQVPEGSKVFTFGHVQMDELPVSSEGFELPEVHETAEESDAVILPPPPAAVQPAAQPEEQTEQPKPLVPDDFDPAKFTPKPVDLGKLRQKRVAAAKKSEQRKERITDEEKAIRTGVMGMLLYIHQNICEEQLTNSELYSEFMKIYPGSAPREAAAMAQFASDTLAGTSAETRAKLFMFASRAPGAIKRKLLDFVYSEYVCKLSETADEEIFRDFLRAICDTLFEDSPEYEYSSYLRSRDILKDPPLRREASYRRISFEGGLGKVNLYANDRYPFERTLEQVGFQHFTFDAIKNSLLIEVSDSRYYEDLENMVYREREPSLLQFIVIDTPMGYLYLEKRCVDNWQVDERDVWAAAERNMLNVDIRTKYSFASSEFSSFRYIQNNLASYVLCMPDLLHEISCGQDLIISMPCREIAYIDFYDFAAIKKMLEFGSRYDCTLIINGEEFEHPFSSDVFIYHADSGVIDRVNDETYILLGDSVARRQVLSSVLPLNIDFSAEKLVSPQTTDDVVAVSEEQCLVQEAIFTLLRVYSEMNGDRDYTIPQNVLMGIVDELFITFDAVYPPARGREQPDPMDHLPEIAMMAARGGKTVCWLLVQALQYLCGDIKYETPTSGHIRQTVVETIYGDNANAVWLNCATASDFTKRLEAVKKYFEKPVDNHHLMILDSQVEVAMHVLTMLFHQFGRRYALGQVRRHIIKAVPDMFFTYELNQSAWLPAPGEDVDVDAQSLGMIFRGFDRATQERMLSTFADAIGDHDLSEGGWPLLYFIKFVKYAYLDPVEMVERYFISRSRLIPSQTVLKQLYYKDLNNEFVKHSRKSGYTDSPIFNDAFDERIVSDRIRTPIVTDEPFDEMLGLGDMPELNDPMELVPDRQAVVPGIQKPDIQLTPVEPGYLEKKLSFVLEDLDPQTGNALRDAAHYVTKVFHVPEVMFKANDDLECELHYGIIRSVESITTLRSFAWTLAELVLGAGRDMRDVNEADIRKTVETVMENHNLHYKTGTKYFNTLCSMPLDDGMYIPCQQEYVFFAQELMPEVRLASLFSLQNELTQLAPAMKLTYDILRDLKKGEIMPPKGVLFDVLCAWSAYCFASSAAFEVSKGPQMYNYSQIDR
ncbi:MAG: pentapeptide repeat-containing protein [Ruminococcaceae bacterium]|nr:pentapeptide repeat-containing protein [Oscillospiraceae bacterium]